MGCDIHMYVEKLDPETRTWEFIEPEGKEAGWNKPDGTPYIVHDWYWGRDYRLFAMLADVRNGYGVAGCDTGDRIEPIDEPRGIPEDASERYKRIAGDYECGQPCEGYASTRYPGDCDAEHGWGVDGHSHSWFTLRELTDVKWDDLMITQRGWVSPPEFKQWLENGRPHSWSGGVSGGSVRHVSNHEMAELIAKNPALLGQDRFAAGGGLSYYTQVQWTQTWRQALTYDDRSEWFDFLQQLGRLTLDDGSDVRAVFFFDN